jgi:hypothetical protein
MTEEMRQQPAGTEEKENKQGVQGESHLRVDEGHTLQVEP